MPKKTIFLASSSELEDDRKDFEIFINRKNKEWHNKGVFLELIVWEDFLDAVSKTRLQDEYNKAIKECDIFLMLFFTKVGKYTEEEFEAAFGQFKETNKPLIYTYFRDSNIKTGDIDDTINSMLSFKRKLKELGHFVTVYKNIEELQLKFTEQLAKLANDGFIKFDQQTPGIFTASKFPKELTNSLPKTHPDDIIGREQDIEELHRLLHNDKRVIVVNGLGGIGKTSLAQAYTSKYYDDYSHILWITQGSENIVNDFINADGLLKNLDIELGNTEPQQLLSEVIRKLKAIAEKPNLLIIDNAEQSLKQYKDILPGQPNWHLVVTSREVITGFQIKSVGLLNEEQSVELFKKYYTHHTLNDADIKDIVRSVDYHTLTIEILAKTAQVQRYDAITLRQAIAKDLKANVEVDRPNAEVEKVGTYLSNVFNLSKLEQEEIWLMKQFACLPPEFHPYVLLSELLVDEESAYKNGLAETCNKLAQKGWLQYNPITDSYKMHRIVAGIVQQQENITFDDIKILIDAVAVKLSTDPAKDNPIEKFIWVPFGKSILDKLNDSSSAEVATLQNNLALRLQDLGDYEYAKVLLEEVIASAEKNFGNDHPTTVRRYSNLATVLRDLGNYEGAKALLEKALISNEKNFGKDHPTTAISYSNLAMILRDLGDYENARTLLEKALISSEKNFGKDHPFTATRYSNLALVQKDLGDYNSARVLFEKALVSNEKSLGKDHPTTAISYSNLATVLQDFNDYQGAIVLLEKAVASDEKNFGKDHPSTATRYSNLALVLKDFGDYTNARVLLQKAVASDEKTFGKDHPSTARSYANLALVLQDMGDYAGAKTLLEKAVASNEKTFGKDHPSTITSYSNLGLVLEDLGDFEVAKVLLQKALASNEKNFGKDHPSTAKSYSNLALVLQDLGDYQGAKVLLEKAAISVEKNFGKDHPFTAISYSNLALVLKDLGNYEHALEFSDKAVSIFKKALPAGHPNIKTAVGNYNSIKESMKE